VVTVRSRWPWIAAVLVTGVGITVSLAGLATGQDGPSPIPLGCQLETPQPEAPLKLNVVAMGNLAKTVAMEKEVFDCFDAHSNFTQVKDVETFIEVVERAKGKSLSTVQKRIEGLTCLKDFATGRVSCKARDIPLGATSTPLAGCSPMQGTYPFERVEQPSHPVEMATTKVGGNFARTAKVEKEVVSCGGQIGDVYLFTEIIESKKGDAFRIIAKQFSGVICLKNAQTAELVSCKLFIPNPGVR
jgi:hypothetical protein